MIRLIAIPLLGFSLFINSCFSDSEGNFGTEYHQNLGYGMVLPDTTVDVSLTAIQVKDHNADTLQALGILPRSFNSVGNARGFEVVQTPMCTTQSLAYFDLSDVIFADSNRTDVGYVFKLPLMLDTILIDSILKGVPNIETLNLKFSIRIYKPFSVADSLTSDQRVYLDTISNEPDFIANVGKIKSNPVADSWELTAAPIPQSISVEQFKDYSWEQSITFANRNDLVYVTLPDTVAAELSDRRDRYTFVWIQMNAIDDGVFRFNAAGGSNLTLLTTKSYKTKNPEKPDSDSILSVTEIDTVDANEYLAIEQRPSSLSESIVWGGLNSGMLNVTFPIADLKSQIQDLADSGFAVESAVLQLGVPDSIYSEYSSHSVLLPYLNLSAEDTTYSFRTEYQSNPTQPFIKIQDPSLSYGWAKLQVSPSADLKVEVSHLIHNSLEENKDLEVFLTHVSHFKNPLDPQALYSSDAGRSSNLIYRQLLQASFWDFSKAYTFNLVLRKTGGTL